MDNKRNYYHADLTDFQAAHIKFLKQEVNRCQDEVFRKDADRGAQQRLWYARQELERYVTELRNQNKKV